MMSLILCSGRLRLLNLIKSTLGGSGNGTLFEQHNKESRSELPIFVVFQSHSVLITRVSELYS